MPVPETVPDPVPFFATEREQLCSLGEVRLLRGLGATSVKSFALLFVSSPSWRSSEHAGAMDRLIAFPDVTPPGETFATCAFGVVPVNDPHATQSSGMASKQTAPPALSMLKAGSPLTKSGAPAASVSPIRIVSWLSPLAWLC